MLKVVCGRHDTIYGRYFYNISIIRIVGRSRFEIFDLVIVVCSFWLCRFNKKMLYFLISTKQRLESEAIRQSLLIIELRRQKTLYSIRFLKEKTEQ